jgi:hypothetical protein
LAVEEVVQRGHVDQDAGRERRERGHPEVIGAGGGRCHEHDLVLKQGGFEQGAFTLLHLGVGA